MKIDWMLTILAIGVALLIVTFWRASRSHHLTFNALDLIMENGKAERKAVAFMIVLAVSIWVLVDLEMKGKMTEGYYTIFIGAWVLPVVAYMFAPKGSDGTTTVTVKSTIESTEKTTP
jgi:hypothetical protein